MNALKHLAEKLHHHDKHAHDTKHAEEVHDHTAANTKNTPPSFVAPSTHTTAAPSLHKDVAHDKHTAAPSLHKDVVHDKHTAAPSLHKDVVVEKHTTVAPVVVEEHSSHSLLHRNKSDKKVTIAEPIRPNVITTETFDYETIVADPKVDERIRTDVLLEVQPVVHKEIDQEVVHHIEKHITEAPEHSRAAEVTLAPKIIEHVHTHVIEEVQPIIHREVAVQKVEKVQEFKTEHVVAPAQHLNEVTHEVGTGRLDLNARHEGHVHVAKPIIDERIRTDVLVEVQPIIHKEIDRTQINHIEKHITEAPAPSLAGRVQLAPTVQENVHVHEIDEVQPIVHREKAVVKVDHVDQHITERVVAPTAHTHSLSRETSNTKYTAGALREEGKIINAPIIDERIRTDTLVEVQPVVHREIDQDVVHHIERHIDEAPAPSMAGKIQLAPKIEEHVHTHVINEVQPVVHKEVAQQKIERVEEHLTEKIVAPAAHTHAVVNERAVDGHYHGEASSAVHRVHAPIIDEKLRTDVVVEVQPVVHKEIDQEVVNHVEKHITEAPAPSMAGKVQLAPKIEEKVHTHIINEIQPIVHTEKAVRVVEHKDEHITEHVTAPAVHTHETITEGVAGVKLTDRLTVAGEQKSFLPAGGAPVVATSLNH